MTADEAAARPAAPIGSVNDEIVRQSLDAVIVTDRAFVVTTWNPAAEQIYGIAAADAVGLRFGDVIETLHPSGRPLDSPAEEAELAAVGSWRRRVIHRPRVGARAGRDVIVDSVVATLRDRVGSPTGILAINRDVTVTATLEGEIAALGSLVLATDRARTKADVADAALEILIRATGADAGLVTSTDATYEATAHIGVAARTIEVILSYGQLGGPLAKALEAPDAYISTDVATAPLREDVRAAVLGDGIRHLIVVGLRLAGRLTGILALGWRRTAPIEPSRAIVHPAAALVAASLENARLLAAVEAGLEGERVLARRYRDLFEASPEALLVEDRDEIVVDANPAAIRLYGEGLIGTPVAHLVAQEPRHLDVDADTGTVVHATGIGRRLDGSTFPEDVELRTLEIGGEPHVLAIVRDLTDDARMRAELVQAQKMEAIGLLVAGVAHELNNPLASIVAFSQLLRSDPTLPADLRTQADLLVQEANRTRVIVQNLLDFARQRPPERVRTDLRPLVESVVGLQSYVLSRNEVALELDIPDDLPALLVDRGQIQQVLINLTFNSTQAIRSAGRPGTIRIEARPGRADEPCPGNVRIAIHDDGPGVSPAVADRLFMPFVTTKAPGEGTGLGLSVSFGIVSAHGGTLAHEPSPAGGATFVIELPIDGAPHPPDASRRAARDVERRAPAWVAAPGARLRILVLDDEPAIREFLARALTRAGYEPVLASSGAAALEVVRSDPPAGILCDHRMAGMTGTEFHALVSDIAPDLSRRFAFMSGDVLNPELSEVARERGVHLLAKPFDLSTVETVVAALLARPA